jgi:hypothetical protein
VANSSMDRLLNMRVTFLDQIMVFLYINLLQDSKFCHPQMRVFFNFDVSVSTAIIMNVCFVTYIIMSQLTIVQLV